MVDAVDLEDGPCPSRPFGWWKMSQAAIRQIAALRAGWRRQDREAVARNAQTQS